MIENMCLKSTKKGLVTFVWLDVAGNTWDTEASYYGVWWTATQGQWSGSCHWWSGTLCL